MPFRFAEPQLSIALLFTAIVVIAGLNARAIAARIDDKFADIKLQPFVIFPQSSKHQRGIGETAWSVSKYVVPVIAIILISLALLRPQYGFTTVPLPRLTSSIVICLDNSLSMGAEDFKPSRFEHARRKLLDLLNRLRGERVGLITFAGVPFVESPLTDDYTSLKTFILGLKPQAGVAPGSDIGSAITTATGLLPKDNSPSLGNNVILIVSDGETTIGDLKIATERSQHAGARVFGLMVATPTGAPVPSNSGARGFKTDSNGNIVISKLETGDLEKLAGATGGQIIISTPGNEDLRDLYQRGIGKLSATRETGEREVQIWNEYYQLPLFFALILLLGERLFAGMRNKRLLVLGLSVLLTFPSVGKCASSDTELGAEAKQAFEAGKFAEALKLYRSGKDRFPTDRRFSEGEAAALLRLGSTKEAVERYRELAAEAETGTPRAKQLFQAGVAAYRANQLEEAKSLFEDSLKQFPNDKETQENLRFIEKLLKEQQHSSSSQSTDAAQSSSPGSDSAKSDSSQSQWQSSESQVPSSQASGSAGSDADSSGTADSQGTQSEGAISRSSSSQTARPEAARSEAASSRAGASGNGSSEGATSEAGASNSADLAGEMSNAGSSTSVNSDQLQYLLDNLEEDPSVREQFRREQAERYLRQNGRAFRPEKDW